MYSYRWEDFLYIKCPKNACMTFSSLLEKNGWQEHNLFENELNFAELKIWAHISDPERRHTRGVDQYLKNNPEIKLDDPIVGKMLVSGVFDEHTYSLSMMLGPLFDLDIFWIPIDAEIVDWRQAERSVLDVDSLTNDFFTVNKIPIQVSMDDRMNVSNKDRYPIREKIEELKRKHNTNYQKLVKNFLEPDILLYNRVLEKTRQRYLG